MPSTLSAERFASTSLRATSETGSRFSCFAASSIAGLMHPGQRLRHPCTHTTALRPGPWDQLIGSTLCSASFPSDLERSRYGSMLNVVSGLQYASRIINSSSSVYQAHPALAVVLLRHEVHFLPRCPDRILPS